jgi:hypothetical protein
MRSFTSDLREWHTCLIEPSAAAWPPDLLTS